MGLRKAINIWVFNLRELSWHSVAELSLELALTAIDSSISNIITRRSNNNINYINRRNKYVASIAFMPRTASSCVSSCLCPWRRRHPTICRQMGLTCWPMHWPRRPPRPMRMCSVKHWTMQTIWVKQIATIAVAAAVASAVAVAAAAATAATPTSRPARRAHVPVSCTAHRVHIQLPASCWWCSPTTRIQL